MQARDPALEPAILVVDDRPANLLAFRAILEPLGQPLVTATTGQQALRHLLQREFALILVDVQMPGMDGFELAALIKSNPRFAGIPIIFVTALQPDATHIFSGYAHGAVDYLLKPFEPEMLRAKVRVFSELHRAQRTVRQQAQLLHQHELRELERRNDERFRGLTESLPFPVWGVMPDGTIYVCNRAWTDYSGLSLEETGPMFASIWVHHGDLESATLWQRATQTGTSFDVECRLRSHDASYRWHLLRAVPQRGARSETASWIVAGIDIDAQKMAEEERARLLEREQHARAQAEAANRMKDEFLAMVSHELRTPLSSILGWTRVLRTGALEGERLAKAIETIDRNAQTQARLINDLLDVSRIVSGKLLLELAQHDLDKLLREVVEAVRPAAEAKRIAIHGMDGVPPIRLVCDGGRVRQVLSNLVSNALKFTPAEGRVSVQAVADGDCARIVVEDTGDGIEPDFLPFVFDRFRQQVRPDGQQREGLGLGLSIAKHLVGLHGGHLLAESQGRGRGARFTVLVPTAGPVPRCV
jgi:PAS domain S-box-containing protein